MANEMNDPVGRYATMNTTSKTARACPSTDRIGLPMVDPSNDVMSEGSNLCEATKE